MGMSRGQRVFKRDRSSAASTAEWGQEWRGCALHQLISLLPGGKAHGNTINDTAARLASHPPAQLSIPEQ